MIEYFSIFANIRKDHQPRRLQYKGKNPRGCNSGIMFLRKSVPRTVLGSTHVVCLAKNVYLNIASREHIKHDNIKTLYSSFIRSRKSDNCIKLIFFYILLFFVELLRASLVSKNQLFDQWYLDPFKKRENRRSNFDLCQWWNQFPKEIVTEMKTVNQRN